MVSKSLVYVQHIKNLIDTVVETQYKRIDEVSSLMVNTIKEGKCIYVFGASHAGIIAEDSCIELDNFDQKVAPTSTVIGALIVNMLVVQVAEKLLELGIDPPIYHSANVDGGDEFNQLMFEKYKNQIHYL